MGALLASTLPSIPQYLFCLQTDILSLLERQSWKAGVQVVSGCCGDGRCEQVATADTWWLTYRYSTVLAPGKKDSIIEIHKISEQIRTYLSAHANSRPLISNAGLGRVPQKNGYHYNKNRAKKTLAKPKSSCALALPLYLVRYCALAP